MDHQYYFEPQNLLDYRKKVTDKLIRGREYTNQLQAMLTTQSAIKIEQPMLSQDDLIIGIIGSFDDALALLNSDHHHGSPLVTDPGCLKLEESGETRKSSTSLKDRKGCYKRRKTSETTTKLVATLTDDGFAWRKYGQKSIHNTKHPRNYYRCTHKFDQDCQATKQVQRTEDEPPMYRTVYHGHHTCKDALNNSPDQIIFHPTEGDGSSILLNFAAYNPAHSPDPKFLPFKMKQESTVVVSEASLRNEVESVPQDYLMSPDLTAFDSYGPMLSSGSNHGDVISPGVYSCTTSTRSDEMDPIIFGSGGFNYDEFPFDFLPSPLFC